MDNPRLLNSARHPVLSVGEVVVLGFAPQRALSHGAGSEASTLALSATQVRNNIQLWFVSLLSKRLTEFCAGIELRAPCAPKVLSGELESPDHDFLSR